MNYRATECITGLGGYLVDLGFIATLFSRPQILPPGLGVDVVSPGEQANVNPNEPLHEVTLP